MSMDKLWAPWRVKYITRLKDQGKKSRCVFCKISREKNDKKNFIFLRTDRCFSVLNIYPYNNGHVLIVPYRHVDDPAKLRKEERDDLFELLLSTKTILEKTMKPGGYNIGINLGRTAGAGFPGHIHIHIVPRWAGDANFMPVTASTKVISQSLETLFDRLYRCVHEKKSKN